MKLTLEIDIDFFQILADKEISESIKNEYVQQTKSVIDSYVNHGMTFCDLMETLKNVDDCISKTHNVMVCKNAEKIHFNHKIYRKRL